MLVSERTHHLQEHDDKGNIHLATESEDGFRRGLGDADANLDELTFVVGVDVLTTGLGDAESEERLKMTSFGEFGDDFGFSDDVDEHLEAAIEVIGFRKERDGLEWLAGVARSSEQRTSIIEDHSEPMPSAHTASREQAASKAASETYT